MDNKHLMTKEDILYLVERELIRGALDRKEAEYLVECWNVVHSHLPNGILWEHRKE